MFVKPQPKADLHGLDRQHVNIFQIRGGLRAFFKPPVISVFSYQLFGRRTLKLNQIQKGTPMKSIAHLAPEIQRRMSGFITYLSNHRFSRPEVKNIRSLLKGIVSLI